jgi:hypothetical protein
MRAAVLSARSVLAPRLDWSASRMLEQACSQAPSGPAAGFDCDDSDIGCRLPSPQPGPRPTLLSCSSVLPARIPLAG